ncbi:MAG: hypothetical protein R2932_41275 [Caldilineaceae bacterium]
MFDPLGDLLTFIAIVIVGLFVWGAFSPFEALGWWAGWFGERVYVDQVPPDQHIRVARPNAESYILFLSGIGRASGETFSRREQGFLQRLADELPRSVIIDDIFPYSVNNLALTGQPFFARFWRWALRRKIDGPTLAGYVINIRNIWQVCISADKRYGPIYNQAVAEVLLHSLLRYDYSLVDQRPVFIIGYSGAGQMAVGAVTYLRELIQAPIYVISLAGIFSSDPGVLAVNHLYHLYGDADFPHRLGLLAPGRWPIFPSSAWNRARRQGLITMLKVGPMCHTGAGAYLDIKSHLPGGQSYLDHTVQTVTKIVRRHTDHLLAADQRAVRGPKTLKSEQLIDLTV